MTVVSGFRGGSTYKLCLLLRGRGGHGPMSQAHKHGRERRRLTRWLTGQARTWSSPCGLPCKREREGGLARPDRTLHVAGGREQRIGQRGHVAKRGDGESVHARIREETMRRRWRGFAGCPAMDREEGQERGSGLAKRLHSSATWQRRPMVAVPAHGGAHGAEGERVERPRRCPREAARDAGR